MNILNCIYPEPPGKNVLLEALFTEEEIENNKHLQYLVENVDLKKHNQITLNQTEHTLILNMSLYNEHKGENAAQKALTRLAIKNDWNYVKYILLNDERLTFEEQLSWITAAINGVEENQKAIYADKLLTFILHDSHSLLNPISNRLSIIKFLLENKANIDFLNKYNETLMHLVCKDKPLSKAASSTFEFIKYLIENKANLNTQSNRINQYPPINDTPLGYALDNSRVPFTCIKYLIEQNAHLSIDNPDDKNDQLNYACELFDDRKETISYLETIKYLIETKANINNETNELELVNIQTPLPISFAAKRNNVNLLKLLFFHGAIVPNDFCKQLQEQQMIPHNQTQLLLNCLEKNDPQIYKNVQNDVELFYPTKVQTSIKTLLLCEYALFGKKPKNERLPKPIRNIIMGKLVELETEQARQDYSNSK